MEKKTQELALKMQRTPHWEQLPWQTLTWDQAYAKMMQDNIELQKSRNNLKTTRRSVTEVFTQMIPGINLDLMLTKDISELSRINPNELQYHTNILFNFPSITRLPLDYYSAKAAVFAAEKNIQMKERELLAKLYQCVVRYQNIEQNYKNQIHALPYDDDGVQRQQIEDERERSLNDVSQNFGELFGTMEHRFLVNPDTMPRIDWNKYKQATQHLDLLVVTLAAMELESSRLQVLNAQFQFFPTVDINFYSPSLFSSTGGTYSGVFAGGGDMTVNMSLRQEMDTRLTRWFQYKTVKEAHELVKREIVIRLQQRRMKVAALMESRRRFELWQQVSYKEIAFREQHHATNGDDYLEQRKNMRKLYEDIDRENTRNAEVEAALIMEYGWLN